MNESGRQIVYELENGALQEATPGKPLQRLLSSARDFRPGINPASYESVVSPAGTRYPGRC